MESWGRGRTGRSGPDAGQVLAEEPPAATTGQSRWCSGRRGGVPVAARIAARLGGQLDVMTVRKIGASAPRRAGGRRVASGPLVVLNDDVIWQLGLRPEDVDRRTQVALGELAEQERRFRGDRPMPALGGRTVILVDDGLATGATMRPPRSRRCAGWTGAGRRGRPGRAAGHVSGLAGFADELVCPLQPASFSAVGQWYRDFTATTDDDVLRFWAAVLTEHSTASSPDGRQCGAGADNAAAARPRRRQRRRRRRRRRGRRRGRDARGGGGGGGGGGRHHRRRGCCGHRRRRDRGWRHGRGGRGRRRRGRHLQRRDQGGRRSGHRQSLRTIGEEGDGIARSRRAQRDHRRAGRHLRRRDAVRPGDDDRGPSAIALEGDRDPAIGPPGPTIRTDDTVPAIVASTNDHGPRRAVASACSRTAASSTSCSRPTPTTPTSISSACHTAPPVLR